MTSVLRIELWHVLLLAVVLASLTPFKLLEPRAFLFGGAFMAVNFLLLACGVRWVVTPLAGKGRVGAGIIFLFLKFLLFLGVLLLLFYRVEMNVVSFALGFSTLLAAILVEACYFSLKVNQ